MQQAKNTPQRRRSAAEIRAILVAYHSSGLSQREFAQKRDISLATLTNWLRRERKDSKQAKERPANATTFRQTFIPVQTPKAMVSVGILELVLPEGMILRIPGTFEPDHLKRLLSVLKPC